MYKITIEEITVKEYPEKDYQNIDPETNKKCKHDTYGCACRKEYHETGRIREDETKREILSQEVKELDLTKVIRAVNNI